MMQWRIKDRFVKRDCRESKCCDARPEFNLFFKFIYYYYFIFLIDLFIFIFIIIFLFFWEGTLTHTFFYRFFFFLRQLHGVGRTNVLSLSAYQT